MALATRWSPPRLGPSLEAAVEIDAVWRCGTLPILSDADRAEAQRAFAAYEAMPRGSSPDLVAKLVGTAALGFAQQRLSDAEADARLKLYQANLADIDEDVLRRAFGMAVRESTFFPTVAELRVFARRVPTPRRFIVMRRLRVLLEQPDVETPDEDLVTPEQLRDLIAKVGGALAA